MKLQTLRGFTLTEILVAISIFLIMVAVGVPVFRNFQPNLQLSGIARELATDLRYAQQLSVTEQVNHGIRLFYSENKYQIIRYGATEDILKEQLFPQGINFQEITGFTDDEVKFNPYGAAREAGNIILINIKSKTKNIDVRPSGFIKISN